VILGRYHKKKMKRRSENETSAHRNKHFAFWNTPPFAEEELHKIRHPTIQNFSWRFMIYYSLQKSQQ
jgi:hypothetical protein